MMKIKYLYQLLLSHISILILAFVIIISLFSHFVKEFAYQNKVEELTSYAVQIANEFQAGQVDMRRLYPYQDMLSTRKTQFIIFNEEQQPYFLPEGFHHPPREQLKKSEWNKLKKGQTVMIRADGRFDDEVSLVAQPIFVQNEFKGAVLLISPIRGVEQMVNQVNLYMFYAVISTLVITILVSWLLSKFHVKRIQKLREATDKVASGDYDIHLENSYGDEIGVLASDFNIMAKKLKQSRDEIDRLEKRRRQFIADVSHELKTPLTTINGLVEGLNSHTIPEDKKDKCFSLISEETKRMLRLVKENLDYEKIRSQQITLNKLDVPLIEVFEIVKEHLQQQAEEKQNKLMIQVEDHVIVHADYDRFIQILVNITKNSIQFTQNGDIWLRGMEGYKETIIEIEDTGIGISKEDIEHIWERFYKADISRTNTAYGEYGLGLSIVKQLVEMHQGTVEIQSEEGKGTKFIIRLPLTAKQQ
ncbi:two-component system sensor histidine kinase YclK [Bacillus subtilis]|uniref:two-component system sensor histidine kinase YclK n=1 Tax=Bacillus subtilis TaxID=1423 RepID=UPI000F4609FB|nr:two-component system sensor histidine kinase YclK [Bacillus subtilis]MCL6427600.1 two-component system sensor histidine kinase YclK [Bacillus subtilis]ROT29927.1 sensor histidine kinase [Bacillus subtilis]